ncbi:MAG: MFS transporter [Candidatus Shapirobacteria bacterium]
MFWKKLGYTDRNIGLYYTSSFLDGLRFLLPVWLLWYTRFISMGTVGLVEGLGIIIGMLLEVPTGAFADVVGRRTSVMIGKMGVSIACFTIAFATNSTSLIVGIILWGIFGAFISGSDTALIYDHLLSKNKESLFSKVNSIAAMVMRIGIIIGSFTGGYLYNIWMPLPYFLFGVTSAFEVIVWYFITEPKIDSTHFSWSSYKEMIINGFKSISHSPHIRIISTISVVIVSFAVIFREELNYSFAIDLGLNATSQSLLFGTSGVLKMIAVILIGNFIIRFSQNKVVYTFLFLFAIILISTIFVGNMGGVVIILLVEMISAMASIISDTFLNRELSSKERATSISFINMFTSLCKAIGLFVGMYFVGLIGGRIVFFVFGLVLMIISILLLLWQKKQKLGLRYN